MSKGLQTKTQILKMAMKMASKEGLESITIGRMAKKVGMSKSGLFGHFQSKENLQVEILGSVADRFVEKVVVPALSEPRGEPRIQSIYDHWKSWVKGSSELPGGCLLIAAASEVDDRPGPLRQFLTDKQKQLIETLQRATAIAIEEGHLKETTSIEAFAWRWFSIILGYHHYKRLLDHPQAELFADEAFKELLEKNRSGETHGRT